MAFHKYHHHHLFAQNKININVNSNGASGQDKKVHDDSAFLDALSTSLYRNSNNSILLGGDFNFPGWDWMAGSIKPKSQYPSLHQKFGDIINDNGLAQIVQEPTRQGNISITKFTLCYTVVISWT